MPTEVTWCCVSEKELLFKVVPTPFSCQNKEIFGQRKASENGSRNQNTGFFEQMVKWVAHDTTGALLPIWITNISNTNGATEKIKGRYEHKILTFSL